MKEIAQGYFKNHPSINEFFFTTDQQAFFSKQAAENHAGSLPKDQRDVVCVTREEIEDGGDAKAAERKQKAIDKATEKLNKAQQELSEAKANWEAESDDTKKQKAELAVTTAQKAVEDAEAELKKVSE